MLGLSKISEFMECRAFRWAVRLGIDGLEKKLTKAEIRKKCSLRFVAEDNSDGKNELFFCGWRQDAEYGAFFNFSSDGILGSVNFMLSHKNDLGIAETSKNQQSFEWIDMRVVSPLLGVKPYKSNETSRSWKEGKVNLQLLLGGIEVHLILEPK